MNIIITSGDRSPRYVLDVLKSIHGPVDVFMDSGRDYIPEVNGDLVVKHRHRPDYSLPIQARCAANYVRCLRHLPGEPALIVEDDTVLEPNALQVLAGFVKQIKAEHYAVALYHNQPGYLTPVDSDVHLCQPFVNEEISEGKSTKVWAGTNCVYYSSGLVREQLADFLVWACVFGNYRSLPVFVDAEYGPVYDVIAGVYFMLSKVPIYLISPPVATNIGLISGMGNAEKQHADRQ